MTSMKLALFLAMVAGACSKNAPAPAAPIGDPAPLAAPAAPEPRPVSPAAGAMLASYERARALLAADELAGLADTARELESSARTAGEGSRSAAQLAAIATAAAQLAAAADLNAARDAFGEVSRHLVVLLASDQALAHGLHVYECPMVKGYKKWVQPSAELQNPYMGKRMLACGGESSWN